jgi:hypothetical protein
MNKRTLKVERTSFALNEDKSVQRTQYMIFCPACEHGHAPTVPPWTFNGNQELPTFTPSILTEYYSEKLDRMVKCHSHVTDGKITYCDDCTHDFKGQTLELPVL